MKKSTRTVVVCCALLLAAGARSALGQRGPGGIATGQTPPGQATRWAVLIGVGRYDDHPAISNLDYTVADVTGLHKVLTGEGGCPPEDVVVMSDAAQDDRLLPRRNSIIGQLSASLQLPRAQDVALVYFAGHGVFTYFLMRGLRGEADQNGDKFVGMSELTLYVFDKVRRWAADRQLVQTPKFVGQVVGEIVLMRGVSDIPPPPPPPDRPLSRHAAAVLVALLIAAGA